MTRCLMCEEFGVVDHPTEKFSDRWRDHWYAGNLPNPAYGNATRIARMRRGRYVMIPEAWRGQVTDRQTIRKRPSKRHQERELTLQEQRAPTIEEFYAS